MIIARLGATSCNIDVYHSVPSRSRDRSRLLTLSVRMCVEVSLLDLVAWRDNPCLLELSLQLLLLFLSHLLVHKKLLHEL